MWASVSHLGLKGLRHAVPELARRPVGDRHFADAEDELVPEHILGEAVGVGIGVGGKWLERGPGVV